MRCIFGGVLTENLLNLQYVKGRQTLLQQAEWPKIGQGLVRRIYTEAINKFNEYGKNYYKSFSTLLVCTCWAKKTRGIYQTMK